MNCRLATPSLYGIALLSGILMGIIPGQAVLGGFAWVLAWLSLAPLWILSLKAKHPAIALKFGLCWGLAYHGTALSWIWGLHPMTWMGIPWGISLGIAIAAWFTVSLWGAIIPGLWAIAIHALHRQGLTPLWRIWIAASIWCGLEWLWTQSPLWWTALSLTQSPHNLAIVQLGKISGPGLIAAVIIGVNGCLAEALYASRSCKQNSIGQDSGLQGSLFKNKERSQPILFIGLALLIFGGAHLGGRVLVHQPLITSPEAALKIGVIQGNIPTRIKLYQTGLNQAFKKYRQGYEHLANQQADAVLMPEGAYPFLWTAHHPQVQQLQQMLQRTKSLVWVGTFVPEGAGFTQSLVTAVAENVLYSRYDKVKLVPLGEFIPFEKTIGTLISTLTPLEFLMRPGSQTQSFQTPLGQAAVSICYDSAFPQLLRHQVRVGGEFILSVANNDPYSDRMMAQHHAQDVLRAVESDRWLVRSTNTGYSSVINPQGKTLWRSHRNQYETHLATIYKQNNQTLYIRWGSWVLRIQILVSLIGCLAHRLTEQ